MANEREQESPNAAALTEYKLVTTLPNGREQWDLIADSDLTQATQQAWGVLQEQDRSGVQVEAAKIEWESPQDGPQTEYFYDRQQGFELSRPEGIRLSLEDEANRITEPRVTPDLRTREDIEFEEKYGVNPHTLKPVGTVRTDAIFKPRALATYDREQGLELLDHADEMREKAEAFTRRFGENIFQHPANGQAQQVAAIAYELADYASDQAALTYTNAEAAIAENFIRQLAAGAKTIDLTQEYATDDQTAAQERHEKALENLQELITEAAQLPGYKVAAGHAIAEGLGEREVLAISHRQSQSMVA
jgi:hypothetical protein